METGERRLLNQQNQDKSSFTQNDGQMNMYKKKLFNIVTGISIVILLIILERIFYEMLVDKEASLLHSVQNLLGVIEQVTDVQDTGTTQYWTFKGNFGWDILGYLDIFKYNFLILTAYIGVFFVAFDSLLAIKIGYVTIYAYYIIAFTDLMYSGPRPFWKSNTIASPICQNTFSHPSRSAFLLLFMIYYSVYCFRRRVLNRDAEVPTIYQKKNRWMEAILSVLVVVLLLFKYIMGLDFLVNIVLAVLYFLIYYFTLKFMDSHVDNIILKSSIQEKSAKKYVFYWLLYVVLSFFFITMLYSSMELYPSTTWVKNYIQCASSNDSLNQDLSYEQVLGPWYTFLQSTCLFGLIGAVFGVAYTYRHTVRNYNWFLGPIKKRVYRSLLLLICMIPSLFIAIFQYNIVNSSFVKQIGLNEFFFNAFHYFLLYAFLFGVLPIIFKRIKLIEETDDDNLRPGNLSFFKESMLKDKPSFEFSSNSFDRQDTIKE